MQIDPQYRYKKTYIGVRVDPVAFKGFPTTVEWRSQMLLKKDEFHATICCGEDIFKEVQKKNGAAPEETELKLVELFNNFVQDAPIVLLGFINEFRYAQDERGRATILVRCRFANLEVFFETMNKSLGIAIPIQPAHVTLYTLQKNMGMHIPDEKTMQSLSSVHLPQLETILREISSS